MQYLSVKGKRGRGKGQEKTFNLFPKPNSELTILNRAVLTSHESMKRGAKLCAPADV
ncbi:hypothetical protein FDUTEX481_01114 [Tolypothrix sp. PCC 7601]|nr:hypothetical protein FDUTEX481_01114 [Tolypothrix sp. PCC 7601]